MELLHDRRLPACVQVIAAASRLAAVAYGPHLAELDVEFISADSLESVKRLPKHGMVRALAWSPDERILATGGGAYWFAGKGSRTESIYLWDPQTGRELARFGELFGVRALAFSPDSKWLITAAMNGPPSDPHPSVDLWDVRSGRHLRRLEEFTSVAFVGDRFAFAAVGPKIRCWNLNDGSTSEWLQLGQSIDRIFPCGDGLIVAGRSLELWRGNGRVWAIPNDGVVAIAPDGRTIARGTGARVDNHGPYENAAVELLDASDGRLMAREALASTPCAVAFTGDSRCLIAGGAEGELRCWRLTV